MANHRTSPGAPSHSQQVGSKRPRHRHQSQYPSHPGKRRETSSTWYTIRLHHHISWRVCLPANLTLSVQNIPVCPVDSVPSSRVTSHQFLIISGDRAIARTDRHPLLQNHVDTQDIQNSPSARAGTHPRRQVPYRVPLQDAADGSASCVYARIDRMRLTRLDNALSTHTYPSRSRPLLHISTDKPQPMASTIDLARIDGFRT